jgi:hypothetical protein
VLCCHRKVYMTFQGARAAVEAYAQKNAGSFKSYRDRAFEPSYLFPRAMETDSSSSSSSGGTSCSGTSGSVKYVGRINDYVCLGVKKICVRQ